MAKTRLKAANAELRGDAPPGVYAWVDWDRNILRSANTGRPVTILKDEVLRCWIPLPRLTLMKLKINARTRTLIECSIPSIISRLMREHSCILAGGAMSAMLNSKPFEDWDLWYLGTDYATEVTKLQQAFPYCTEMRQSSDCLTLTLGKLKVQFINLDGAKTVEDVLNHFDMFQCRVAWDGDNMFSDRPSLRAAIGGKIRFHRIEYPVLAIKRLAKYVRKGYEIDDADAMDLVEKIHARLLTYNLVDSSVTKESIMRTYLTGAE